MAIIERPLLFTSLLSEILREPQRIPCKGFAAENIDEFLGKQVQFKRTR